MGPNDDGSCDNVGLNVGDEVDPPELELGVDSFVGLDDVGSSLPLLLVDGAVTGFFVGLNGSPVGGLGVEFCTGA